MLQLLDIAKSFLNQIKIKPDGVLADFTMGNGHDTLYLCSLVPDGTVYAFDIQKQALINTKNRLDEAGVSAKTVLIQDSHENAKNYMDGEIDASIARGGANVSGGQKQRLSIARAVYREPEFYIFDDTFSALDYKTDRILRAALKKETAGVTTLIVAQRIGTIKDADKIIVLDEGRIIGEGTHSELMKDCEIYREIARTQLSQEELG